MAIKMTREEFGKKHEVLAVVDHYVCIGRAHEKATNAKQGLATLVNGRYVVKAGTIYPKNDATAKGVVLEDYDVHDGDVNMAVIVHGFVKQSALPVAPSADAINALKQITFLKED